MEKTAILFAGPSLHGVDTSKYPWLDVCGPACQSDIYSVLNHKHYTRIILADGLYKSIPAPWHKEILLALEMNIEVYGVASLGALRAAELNEYGMKGSGKVYEYISSNIVDDSEVAVMHKPQKNQWEAMTLAHVEVKYWSEKIEEEGRIGKNISREIIKWSKNKHFERRTKKALISQLELGLQDANKIVRDTWFSQKQLDLANLIDGLDKIASEKNNNLEKNWTIAKTPYIYRQISKDTSLLPFQGEDRDYGDTITNFLIFIFLEHTDKLQKILLKIYSEYIELEIVRLKSQGTNDDYVDFFKLYKFEDCFLLNDLFENTWPKVEIIENLKSEEQDTITNSINQELTKMNKDFRLMSKEAMRYFDQLCKLITVHREVRFTNTDMNELLSPNTIRELNKTVLKSLMEGEDVDVEARHAIYYAKQLIDSCSIYTHHGRLRMYTLLKESHSFKILIREWEKNLKTLANGKPHAFYNEEIDHSKLGEKIRELNLKIREVQPFPVESITESHALLFLEADSIAIIEYSLSEE